MATEASDPIATPPAAATIPIPTPTQTSPTTFTHHGPWNSKSRESKVLRFVESYMEGTNRPAKRTALPSTTFYASLAVYHDMKGQTHITSDHIWEFIGRQLSPFSKVVEEATEIRVVQETETRSTIYAEFLSRFWLKGEPDDEDGIPVPRFFVWTLDRAEVGGTEGLQIQEARLFMDTGVIGRYVTERKRRELRKRQLEVGVGIEPEVISSSSPVVVVPSPSLLRKDDVRE